MTIFTVDDMTEEQRNDYLERADKVAQSVWHHVKGQDTDFSMTAMCMVLTNIIMTAELKDESDPAMQVWNTPEKKQEAVLGFIMNVVPMFVESQLQGKARNGRTH